MEGFTKEEAENLQRALARETRADLAATDCARVLRLPGFDNHKYSQSYLVRVEPHAAAGLIYRPEQFPKFPQERSAWHPTGEEGRPPWARNRASGANSQSERDWAFARRALARGESQESVIAAIASYRSTKSTIRSITPN